MSSSSQRQPFHFVFANPGSEKDRKRETQLARSHTARVNRQRRLPARAQSQTDALEQPKQIVRRATTHHAATGKASGRRSDSLGTAQRLRGGVFVEEWIAGVRVEGTDAGSWSSSSSSSSSSTHDDEYSSVLLAMPRTLSPVLGAQSSDTFTLSLSSSETARAADYCINVIWPNLLMDTSTSAAWFAMFRSQPIIYHAFMYALTVHHDLLCNRVSWSVSKAGLIHKTKTITALNQILSKLDEKNIEYAILAVLVLASNELKPEKLLPSPKTGFEPHMPGANWNSVYARMEQVPEHGMAMMMLIQQRGGLEKMKLPGLASVLAFSDILAASYKLSKPIFSCFWREDVVSLLSSPTQPFLPSGVPPDCGVGFRTQIPSSLPIEAAAAFTDLAIVDRVMEHCRNGRLPDPDFRRVVDIRNRAQHQILSLPTWEELDAFDQTIHDRAAYECCRLTVLLYANAVTFPIPSHSGYPSSVLEQIVTLLTPEVINDWMQRAWAFLVWALVVAGVTAKGTEHRAFFERTVIRVVEGHRRVGLQGATPSEALRTAVRAFLWTESACGRGLRELLNDIVAGMGMKRYK